MTNAGSPPQDWRPLYSSVILKVDHARRMPRVSAARLAISGHIEATLAKPESAETLGTVRCPPSFAGPYGLRVLEGLPVLCRERVPGARQPDAKEFTKDTAFASKIPSNAKRAES